MKIPNQSRPVIRNENIAGVNDGICQSESDDCAVCRKMPPSTAQHMCLEMAKCDRQPIDLQPI